ncbi:MAG: hypothetical protein AB8H80_20955 [Planctomycetota bacterium]
MGSLPCTSISALRRTKQLRARTPTLLAALLLLFGMTACATTPPALQTRQQRVGRVVPHPPSVAAALAAEALHEELCHAQAAPVQQIERSLPGVRQVHADATGYRIAFARGPRQQWWPIADHTLQLRCRDATGTLDVRLSPHAPPARDAAPRGELRGGGGGSGGGDIGIEVLIFASGSGARIQTRSAGSATNELVDHVLDRTFALASDPARSGPGASEPNLSALRLSIVLAHACCANTPAERQRSLTRALRVGMVPANIPIEVPLQLAEYAATRGDAIAARWWLRRAALTATDARQRASITARLRELHAAADQPSSMRHRAIGELFAGHLHEAEHALHSARRSRRNPARDYELLRRLHEQRGDEMAAMAAKLLRREHQHDAASGEARPLRKLVAPTAASPPR